MENSNITEKIKHSMNHILKNIPTLEMLKINRQNKIGTIIEFPPIETVEKYDITAWLTFQKYNETVQRFEQTLRGKFPHCDTSIFYKNLKGLRLIPETARTTKLKRILTSKTGGSFFLNDNKIELYGIDNPFLDEQKVNEDILTHELLHMSTNRSNEFVTFNGFEQSLGLKNIGYALNEGYTEYLNCKYFANFPNSKVYSIEKYLAEGIEMIVGTKQMEKNYFASDLKSVLASLSQYRPQHEVVELITKMDKTSKIKDFVTKEKLFNEVKEEIINIYSDKQQKELAENKISEQEYEINTNSIIRDYKNRIILSEKNMYNKRKQDNVSSSRLQNSSHYQSIEMNIELDAMLKPKDTEKSSSKKYK